MATRKKTLKKRGQLSKQHWIDVARDLLSVEGINAVHITRLSRELGVTRGSFYWHFRDRHALLDALLIDWQQRNTGVMCEVVNKAEDLPHGVLMLFAIWEDRQRFDAKFDQAIREWARTSSDVAALVLSEDHHRVATIATLFGKHGFRPPDDYIRARILYFTQLSYYALDIQETPAQRLENLASYFTCYTGEALDAEGMRFFQRLIAQP